MGQIPRKCFDSRPPRRGWSGGSPLFISNLETRVSKAAPGGLLEFGGWYVTPA